MDLRRINLNLILHFDTLLTELSVSKAAEKSFITQTAMSHILKQLREIFSDPLFIREAHGLRPTQKALELMPKIKHYLEFAQEIFQEDSFNPAEEELTFKLVLGSHGEYVILPQLCNYLSQNAPNITLKTYPVNLLLKLEDLLATDTDLAILPGFVINDKNILADTLIAEQAVCVLRNEHPLAQEELTPELFLDNEHINIEFNYSGKSDPIEGILAKYEKKRTVRISVSNVITALEILRNTNYIATIPNQLAIFLQEKYDYQIKPFPFPTKQFVINMFYHQRFANYKPLEWLRNIIKQFREN